MHDVRTTRTRTWHNHTTALCQPLMIGLLGNSTSSAKRHPRIRHTWHSYVPKQLLNFAFSDYMPNEILPISNKISYPSNTQHGLTYFKMLEADYQKSEVASSTTKCKRRVFGSPSTSWYKMQLLMALCAFGENHFLGGCQEDECVRDVFDAAEEMVLLSTGAFHLSKKLMLNGTSLRV